MSYKDPFVWGSYCKQYSWPGLSLSLSLSLSFSLSFSLSLSLSLTWQYAAQLERVGQNSTQLC